MKSLAILAVSIAFHTAVVAGDAPGFARVALDTRTTRFVTIRRERTAMRFIGALCPSLPSNWDSAAEVNPLEHAACRAGTLMALYCDPGEGGVGRGRRSSAPLVERAQRLLEGPEFAWARARRRALGEGVVERHTGQDVDHGGLGRGVAGVPQIHVAREGAVPEFAQGVPVHRGARAPRERAPDRL